jgi:hypothetical protein
MRSVRPGRREAASMARLCSASRARSPPDLKATPHTDRLAAVTAAALPRLSASCLRIIARSSLVTIGRHRCLHADARGDRTCHATPAICGTIALDFVTSAAVKVVGCSRLRRRAAFGRHREPPELPRVRGAVDVAAVLIVCDVDTRQTGGASRGVGRLIAGVKRAPCRVPIMVDIAIGVPRDARLA